MLILTHYPNAVKKGDVATFRKNKTAKYSDVPLFYSRISLQRNFNFTFKIVPTLGYWLPSKLPPMLQGDAKISF